MFQKIQDFVSRLEQGLPLPDDDDDGSSARPQDSGYSSGYDTFFAGIFKRESQYARSRATYFGGGGQVS
jgi:hypothetical protein